MTNSRFDGLIIQEMNGDRMYYTCKICGSSYQRRSDAISCAREGITPAKDDANNLLEVGDIVSLDERGVGIVEEIVKKDHAYLPRIKAINFLSGRKYEICESDYWVVKMTEDVLKEIGNTIGITTSEW